MDGLAPVSRLRCLLVSVVYGTEPRFLAGHGVAQFGENGFDPAFHHATVPGHDVDHGLRLRLRRRLDAELTRDHLRERRKVLRWSRLHHQGLLTAGLQEVADFSQQIDYLLIGIDYCAIGFNCFTHWCLFSCEICSLAPADQAARHCATG
jgi:hypothetical protein